MSGERMIEPRRELRFAQEALLSSIVALSARMQHLDDSIAPERGLFAAIYNRVATVADLLAQNELAQRAPGEIRNRLVCCRLVRHRLSGRD
jgi:Cdc6-like AAA superfamily ATPase